MAFHLLYVIPLTNYEWLNPAYWSLAFEFVFYIIVGLTFGFLIKRRIEWTILLAAVLFGLCYLEQTHMHERVLEFLTGILLMRHIVGNEAERPSIKAWIIVTIAVLFWFGGPTRGVSVTLGTAAILYFQTHEFGRWAYFIGAMSYSLYLTHAYIGERVVALGLRYGDSTLLELAWLAISFAVSIAVALIFVYFIEGPATRALTCSPSSLQS